MPVSPASLTRHFTKPTNWQTRKLASLDRRSLLCLVPYMACIDWGCD